MSGDKIEPIPLVQDAELLNLQTALGTASDARLHTSIGQGTNLSDDKYKVDCLLRWHWGARKFIEERPREALRKWIEIDIEEGDEDLAKQILDRMDELNVKDVLQTALQYQDAYGGAAILILSGDANGASQPLALDRLSGEGAGIRGLRAISRWRLHPVDSSIEQDPMSPEHGLPTLWTLQPQTGQSVTVHASRLIIMLGQYSGERERPYDWGHSLLEPFWTPWRDYASALGYALGTAQRLSETRQYIEGLKSLIIGGNKDKARELMQEYALARSSMRITAVDAEDRIEDASLNLSGLKDLMEAAKEQVAAASGFSVSRFFGTARQGLSDKDESASERDDAQIAEYQSKNLKLPIERLIELLLAEQGMLEVDWSMRFRPLREETPAVRAERRLKESKTDEAYVRAGIVLNNEIRDKFRNDPDAPYPLREGDIEVLAPQDDEEESEEDESGDPDDEGDNEDVKDDSSE